MKTEIFDFTDFFERVTENPQYQNACSLIHQNGHMDFIIEEVPCKVYNPAMAVFFSQSHIPCNRLLIVNEFTLQEQTRTQDKSIPIPIWPLMDAYCTGYQAGRAAMEKKYPNPAAAAKDLKIIFDKELRQVPSGYTFVTSTANMAKIGHQAGQYSMITDWAERYPGSLKNVTTRPESEPEKVLPHLKDIIDERFFSKMIERLQSDGYITRNRNAGYVWRNSLNRLGGLHFMLKKKHKITFSGTNQDAGRIFCSFFNIEMSNEKAFQPSQAATQAYHFNWIPDF
jgi:hypothetical protein